MHLYSLTLQKSTAINKVVYGSFSHPKAQELAVAKGKILELQRLNNYKSDLMKMEN